MKTRIDDNGWTIHIDEDLNNLSNEDIKEIGRLSTSNMAVVLKNQNLSPEKEVEICNVIGDCETTKYSRPENIERFKHILEGDVILRVTGEKNDKGEEGLFGHVSALDWHANQCSNAKRAPLIWLYGVKGTKGSRTSWLNMIRAYEELPTTLKEKIKNKKIYCGHKHGVYSPSPLFREHVNTDVAFDLVMTNKANQTGLYFPFYQTFGMENTDEQEFNELMEALKEHVLQEKFMYHHDWDDGDVVISEQWLSIHKRWEFEGMENRLLHRIAFDYNKIY